MSHTQRQTRGNEARSLDIAALVINEEEGWASRRIFTDLDIHELEVERIFNRCRLFLGHETEIPNPGDYVTRRMGDDPVIVVRGEDGAINAFQRTLREYRVRPETPTETLWAQLRRARLDDYQRRSSKTSRPYPRKKQRTPIGIPHVTRATPHQIAQALQHHEEFRLSA